MLNRLRNRFTSRRAAPLIIAMLVCVPNTAAAQLSIVQARSGPVRGTSAGVDGVMVFRGLPYAAPPTGDRRWRPPAPWVIATCRFDLSARLGRAARRGRAAFSRTSTACPVPWPGTWNSRLEHHQGVAVSGAADPCAVTSGWQRLRVELRGPAESELSTDRQAQTNGLDARAACGQFLQYGSAQRRCGFQQIARLLERLSHPDIAQHFEDGAFEFRHERAVGQALKSGIRAGASPVAP